MEQAGLMIVDRTLAGLRMVAIATQDRPLAYIPHPVTVLYTVTDTLTGVRLGGTLIEATQLDDLSEASLSQLERRIRRSMRTALIPMARDALQNRP